MGIIYALIILFMPVLQIIAVIFGIMVVGALLKRGLISLLSSIVDKWR